MLGAIPNPARFLSTVGDERHQHRSVARGLKMRLQLPVIDFITVFLTFRIRLHPKIHPGLRSGKWEGWKKGSPLVHHQQSPVVDKKLPKQGDRKRAHQQDQRPVPPFDPIKPLQLAQGLWIKLQGGAPTTRD